MQLYELFLTAAALSMDAFAVSVCKGLSVGKLKLRHMLIVGLYFGGFQALMPLLGYVLGSSFESYVNRFSPWIAFILLALIGGNMVKEALSGKEEEVDASFGFVKMLSLAVATSIDALAVGVAFAMVKPQVGIYPAVLIIGVTTFLFSAAGIKIGNVFGAKYKSKAELCGGIVLILLGVKIIAEHFLG